MHIVSLQKKKVAIIGLGVEGVSTAEYCLRHSIPFVIFDEKSEEALQNNGEEWKSLFAKLKHNAIQYFLGQKITGEMLQQCDVVVRSPGISLKAEFLKK